MENLVSDLFKTKAINAGKEDKPFWYTSGKIGMYFINAEFLYGSEEESKALLAKVDEALSNHMDLPKKVFDEVLTQYNSNDIYRETINALVDTIRNNINLDEVDYISGGERRDWVFSNMVSYILKKPHISVFKDMTALVSNSDFSNTDKLLTLEGKKCLHVSDLINTAASYVRAWVPIIEELGGKMEWTITIVDRMQGGAEILSGFGVNTFSLVKVDKDLFKTALENGAISEEQYKMIDKYIDNPYETMREFLITHPEFIEDALRSTGKPLERAKKCLTEDIYGLGDLLKK